MVLTDFNKLDKGERKQHMLLQGTANDNMAARDFFFYNYDKTNNNMIKTSQPFVLFYYAHNHS